MVRREMQVPTSSSTLTKANDGIVLRDSVQRRADGIGDVGPELVEGPDSPLGTGDDPGRLQLGQMVADRRLLEVEGGGEVTDTNGLARGLEHVQHLDTGLVGQCLVDGGEVSGRSIR